MNRKELNKTFVIISNRKNPFGLHGLCLYRHNSALLGLNHTAKGVIIIHLQKCQLLIFDMSATVGDKLLDINYNLLENIFTSSV